MESNTKIKHVYMYIPKSLCYIAKIGTTLFLVHKQSPEMGAGRNYSWGTIVPLLKILDLVGMEWYLGICIFNVNCIIYR